MQTEKWGMLELSVEGPKEGNPFLEHWVEGRFTGADEDVTVDGFYDGDGVYRVRFMPSFEGVYRYCVQGDFLAEEMTGEFTVTPAQEGNHGPVRVAEQYHFAYADGTPHYSVGTTCYVWNHQSDERIAETLKTLEETGINKIRFCVFPKHYNYNLREPRSYPYEGTPMDSSVLTEMNFHEYNGKENGSRWDYFRFCPEHFRHIEYCILELQKRGIEADLIMMHPYDRWGFSSMTKEADAFYWSYAVTRFAAFRNVWWSFANEYDLLSRKTEEDWEGYAKLVMEKDPYNHLRSIHHCFRMYDHSRPWITHCSIQGNPATANALREKFGKPVVMDEMRYEGNLPYPWGNATAKEMTRRFWDAACRGGYPGHGETFLSPADLGRVVNPESGECGSQDAGGPVLWWSHGGKLHGESWKRLGFLRQIMEETPGGGLMLEKDLYGILIAVPEAEKELAVKSYYLYYFDDAQPAYADITADPDTEYEVDIIDTWNMTVTPAGTHRGRFFLDLPGNQYMAVRLKRKEL